MAKFLRSQRKRTKQKGRISGISHNKILLKKGVFGIKAVQLGRLTKKQLGSLKKILRRRLKFVYKRAKRKCRNRTFFPIKCKYRLSKKPLKVRMGKGKGAFFRKVARIQAGRILVEIQTHLNAKIISRIFSKIRQKLPIKCILVKKTVC